MATKTSRDRMLSKKHALIDRANATMMVTIAITSVVVVFTLFAGRALFGQFSYQNRVIGAKKDTLKQIEADKTNAEQLVTSYNVFANEPINILGGNPTGNGPRDGDNPSIILDALPSKYDFPGLISSLEKLLTGGGYQIDNIGGTEQADEFADVDNINPTPIEMPFPLAVTANYDQIEQLVKALESSIRPFYFTTFSLQGTDESLKLDAEAKTFWQPERIFNATKEVVQ